MGMKTQIKSVLSRREFLGWAWTASVAGLFGQAGVAMFNFLKPRIQLGGFGTKIAAGSVDEFKPGTVVHVPKGRFFISRLEDGSMLAIWQRCTHLGCSVPWREDEGQFHCPCHGSLYNRVGEVIGGPAPRPLDIFAIEIVDGQITVDTGSPISRDKFDPSQAAHA